MVPRGPFQVNLGTPKLSEGRCVPSPIATEPGAGPALLWEAWEPGRQEGSPSPGWVPDFSFIAEPCVSEACREL